MTGWPARRASAWRTGAVGLLLLGAGACSSSTVPSSPGSESATAPAAGNADAQASAKAEADRIVAEAKAEADQITAKAKAEATRKAGAKEAAERKASAQNSASRSTASFSNFAVTVSRVEEGADGSRVRAEVCLKRASDPRGTRISLDPWSVSNGSQKASPDRKESTFPSDGTYDVGDCVSGWITFPLGDPKAVEYSNGLGDVAIWDATDLAAKPQQSQRPASKPKADELGSNSGSTSGIGDGSYLVGTEIQPGTWKSSGVEGGLCYADTQNEAGDILQQEVAAEGSVIIRITGKAYTFKSSGCVSWKKVG